jgi:feruloyl-CoA synthase
VKVVEEAGPRLGDFGALTVERSEAGEGGLILRSREELGPFPPRIGDFLVRWAQETPDRVFVAERDEAGAWRELTYGRALDSVERSAQSLLDLGLGPKRPVMLLSGNSIDHAILLLAAMHVGIPVAPISPAYSLVSHDHAKLRHVFDTVRPGAVYVSDEAQFAGALDALDLDGVPLLTSDPQPRHGRSLGDLMTARVGAEVREAFERVGPDTVAKILFTSGSTDLPKGVVNTQRMMCANQQMMAQLWPVLEAKPPVLVDWLPWNHTFGGNHNFNMVLRNGGTLYIDEGKPMPGAFETSLQNLRDVGPTIYFNVPRGFAVLVPRLEEDSALAEAFFRRLDVIFSAAAALPASMFDRLVALAREYGGGEVAMASGWGATETSPMVTGVAPEAAEPGSIGLPAPGVQLRLVPFVDSYELRVKGPNVFPGYFGRDDLTEAAFDEEGFYKIGDAGRFIDPDHPERGLAFDGRVTEDFKLSTGTWVQVGNLRLSLLDAGAGLIQDAVICGHDRDYIAVLAWPDLETCRRLAGIEADDAAALASPSVREAALGVLRRYNAEQKGSSTRVERIMMMLDPPDLDANEITDKGYINQRACIKSRADLVERLFAEPLDPDVVSR